MTAHFSPIFRSIRSLRAPGPALGLAVLLAWTGGCRSLLGESQTDSGAPNGLCSEPVTATGLTLPDAPAAPPPRSRVAVDLVAARSRIESELARQIPVELAAESGQPIGAPGRLSYRVTRGGLALDVQEQSIVLSTNVLVNASVCKPLGPFCPVYGRCAPELVARGEVPLLVDRDYSLPKSRVDIRVTKPCVIAGYDATPRLRRIAEQQAQSIQRQINLRLPRIRPQVQRAWQALESPIALEGDACLRIVPDQVVQSPPRLDDRELALRFSVLGELRLERPCSAVEPGSEKRTLPTPEQDAELAPGVDLRVALVIGWDSVSEQLTRTLLQGNGSSGIPAAGPALQSVRARGVLVDGRPRMALALDRAGDSCDHLVALAVPEYDAAQKQLRLREVQLATPPRGNEARAEADALLASLREHSQVGLPMDLSEAPSAFRELEGELTRKQPAGVKTDLSLAAPTVVQIVPSSDGLVVIVGLTGHIEIAIQ